MKKLLLISAITCSTFTYSQENKALQVEIDQIKQEMRVLRNDIQSVKTQNSYLKKAFDISKPILEQNQGNSDYRITKVVGNKKDKTITINFLIEAKDENKQASIQDFSLVDLLGNQYEIDFYQSSNVNPNLVLNVPLTNKITFKEIIEEPLIVKLFKFKTNYTLEKNTFKGYSSIQEFRDLNVVWE